MNDFKEYLERANDIIGPRSKEEEQYDIEVVKCMKKYGKIRRAINRANKKYPEEALLYDESNIHELQERYEYMLNHYEIIKKYSN